MGSGVDTFTGSFEGTGAEFEVEKVPFKPRVVELYNYTDPGKLVWTEGMPDAGGVKHVDGTMAILTTTGITPTTTGFILGADADMNVAAEIVHFVCHR